MWDIIKIVSLILGSIIGAGFASGQEIKIFFSDYGIFGLIGIVLSVGFMIIIINITLKIILKNNIKTFDKFLECIFKNNKILNYVIKSIVNIFLFSSFLIMCIGFVTCLEEQFLISKYIAGIIVSILLYLTFIGNIERVIKVNIYIVPLLICCIIFIGYKVLVSGGLVNDIKINMNFIPNSFVYASYNLIPLISVLSTVSFKKINIKKINIITIISFVLILVLAICIFMVTLISQENTEIILIEAVKKYGFLGNLIFSFVILGAIYTSAVCSGYAFLKNLTKTDKQYRKVIFIMCMLAILVSGLKFSSVIEIIYPFFGICGFVQIFYIIKFYSN